MAFEFTKKIKTGLILLVGTGFGLYFGYLLGAALIASAMNPVGAGFLALLLTAMIILALVGTLWAIQTKFFKDDSDLDSGFPTSTDPQSSKQFEARIGYTSKTRPNDRDEPEKQEDWMLILGGRPEEE